MSLKAGRARSARWHDRRRGARVNSRVRVAVEWEDAMGQTLRTEGFTRVVNPTGCLLILPRSLPLDQRVRLINLELAACQPAPGVVVWHGQQVPDGHELGLEFEKSPFDFWGMQL